MRVTWATWKRDDTTLAAVQTPSRLFYGWYALALVPQAPFGASFVCEPAYKPGDAVELQR